MPRRLPKYCCEDTDRHGNVRVYYRRPGQPKIRIHGMPWTLSFMAQYEQLLHGAPSKPVVARNRASENTWAWLCQRYFSSHEFKRVSLRTQRVRRQILEATFDEPLRPDSQDRFRDFPVDLMSTKAIRVLRDRKGATPDAANERLKAIRQVFKVGVANEDTKSNPARDVEYIQTVSDGFYTWTEEDIAQFRSHYPSGTKARRAFELLLVLGPRRQDVVTLGRQKIQNGTIKFKPKKTEKTSGVDVEIEIPTELATELALMPPGRMLFIETEFGKPYSVNGFGNWFKRQCRLAGLHQCSAHGLRKAGAALRAENGATDYDLMALYGWADPKTAQVYTRKARRKKMAARAMGLLTKSVSPEA